MSDPTPSSSQLYDQRRAALDRMQEERNKQVAAAKNGENLGAATQIATKVGDYLTGGTEAAQGLSTGGQAADSALAAWHIGDPLPAFDAGMQGADAAASNASSAGLGTLGTAATIAGALKGGYDMYNAWKNNGKGARTAATELGASIGTYILPGIGTAIGAVGGNALGYLGKRFGLFHQSTKDAQAERAGELASKDPSYLQYAHDSQTKSAEIQAAVDRANAAHANDPEYQGWDENGWVNNKLKTYADSVGMDMGNADQDDPEYLKRLGSGDTMFMPWNFENIKNWGGQDMGKRIQFEDALLKSGTIHGNAGNLDFTWTPELQALAKELFGEGNYSTEDLKWYDRKA